jgi:hypothetical protein
MLRLWLIRMMPFLSKYLDVAPACCGTCPTCIGTAATGLTLELFSSKPKDES